MDKESTRWSVPLLIVPCLCVSRWFSQKVSINDVSFVVVNTWNREWLGSGFVWCFPIAALPCSRFMWMVIHWSFNRLDQSYLDSDSVITPYTPRNHLERRAKAALQSNTLFAFFNHQADRQDRSSICSGFIQLLDLYRAAIYHRKQEWNPSF